MDFPSYPPEKSNFNLETIKNVLGARPNEFFSGIYGLATFNTEEEITAISPNLNYLKIYHLKELLFQHQAIILILFPVFSHQHWV